MKKRILAGLLAALMLCSAYAAEDTATDVAATDATVTDAAAQDEPVIEPAIEPTAPDISIDPPEPTVVTEPEPIVSYPDVAGHWAEDAMLRAASLGIIQGYDGKLMPDGTLTGAEALAILNRTLGGDIYGDTSSMTIPAGVWYGSDIAKAVGLGLVAAGDKRDFNIGATRAQAFVYFARAFDFTRTESPADVLSAFTDTGSMNAEATRAAAALIAAGVVKGETDTLLAPDGTLTRAAFVTMLLRTAQQFPAADADLSALSASSLIRTPAVTLSSIIPRGDRIFAADVESIELSAVRAGTDARFVCKGSSALTLSAHEDTSLAVLALDPAGAAAVTLSDTSSASTLLLSGTGGAIRFDGQATNIEITATNREIDLTGLTASSLTVLGSGNVIRVTDSSIDNVDILGAAKNTTLSLDGSVTNVTVAGVGSSVSGSAHATNLTVRAVNCNISLDADTRTDDIDRGLDGVSVALTTTAASVPAGGALVANVTFTGVAEDKIVSAEWLQDGKPIAGCYNPTFSLTPAATSTHRSEFLFQPNMATSVTIGFQIAFYNSSTGTYETASASKTVPIENYSAEWYAQRDRTRILNLVSSTYAGNYTRAYAENNDYKDYEKEVWVNAKGYSSNTGYLIWINRAYQHVNIFSGSKGNWKLIKGYLVGTGASNSQTPTGVTSITYKSAAGWTTSTYTVKPVVGFYPGSGYAFHSRLFYSGTTTLQDGSIGYPISHGCVRMYDADVQWIYNNMPIGTTVVIY